MILNDKLVHLVSYFFLMLTFDFSVKSGEVLWIKALVVFLYSCAIEYAQDFVPGRDMSMLDLIANGIGIVAYILCVPLLKRLNVYTTLGIIR